MSEAGAASFEAACPSIFAASVKDLADDVALHSLLQSLCARLRDTSVPVGIVRRPDDGSARQRIVRLDGPVGASYPIPDGSAGSWGYLEVAASAVLPFTAESLVSFVAWIVERHGVRRRRLAHIDRERQRIAGEIHDDPIQAMTAVSLNLQRLAHSNAEARADLLAQLELVNRSIDRLRHMMFSLHPPTLAADGLVLSFEDYLDTFVAPSGIRTSVRGDPDRRVDPQIEALAFRLGRGAIHNSWKHAAPSEVVVDVVYTDDSVVLQVRDDGIGFEVTATEHPHVGHAGLDYARDLASQVGGTYTVASTPGRGTEVTVTLPTA